MADWSFPWQAFAEAQARKRQNQKDLIDALAQGIQGLTSGVGQGIEGRNRNIAQRQFSQMMSPAQGPQTAGGQGPAQPPIDLGRAFALWAKGYPGQQMPTALTDYIDPLRKQKAALEERKVAAQEAQAKDRDFESKYRTDEMARHDKEMEALRRQSLADSHDFKRLLYFLNRDKFNAGQTQKSDTINRGFFGNLKNRFGFGVQPTTVGGGGRTPEEEKEMNDLLKKHPEWQ